MLQPAAVSTQLTSIAFHRRNHHQPADSMSSSQQGAQPLTEDEQDKIIENLKKEAKQQMQTIRNYFSFIFAFVAVLFIVLTVYTSEDPYILTQPMKLTHLQEHELIILYYVSSSICFAVSALVVKVSLFLYCVYIFLTMYNNTMRAPQPAVYIAPII